MAAKSTKTAARHTVWHMEPISANGSTNRINHARGQVRSDVTAAAVNGINPAAAERGVIDLGSATDEEVARDRDARAMWLRSRRGRRPEPYVEFMLAGPPQYGSDERWPAEKEAEWAEAALGWVQKRFPDSLVVVASHHRDETAPHVHIVLSPRSVDEQGRGEWGWCRARNQAVELCAADFLREKAAKAALEGERPAKAAKEGKRQSAKRQDAKQPTTKRITPKRHNKVGAKKALAVLQNDVHAHVGAPFGLMRGERGSKKQHKAVDKMTAAIGHAREVAKSVAASRRKAAQFSKRLAQRERRIQAVETEQGAMAEREAEVAAQAEQIATAAEELAHFQQQMRQLAESLHRRQRAAQHKEEVNEKKQAENADKERRILVSMACMTHASTCVISDFDRWQELAHQALIGSPDDVDEIEAIVEPEPEPPPPTMPTPPRKPRKRRRRKPSNVVDFRPPR